MNQRQLKKMKIACERKDDVGCAISRTHDHLWKSKKCLQKSWTDETRKWIHFAWKEQNTGKESTGIQINKKVTWSGNKHVKVKT